MVRGVEQQKKCNKRLWRIATKTWRNARKREVVIGMGLAWLWKRRIQFLESQELMTDKSDKWETESASVKGALSLKNDFGLEWSTLSAVLEYRHRRKADPRLLDLWLSRENSPGACFSSLHTHMWLYWQRSLPCSIEAFSSKSLCGFPLSLSCCHHLVSVLQSVMSFKQMFAVHFSAKSDGSEVATSCSNSCTLNDFAMNGNILYLTIVTASTFPANSPL